VALRPERDPLAKIDLPYLKAFKVAGRWYYYFNRRCFPQVRLPGEPLSREWTAAYNEAKEASNAANGVKRHKVAEGSIADLVARYYASSDFRKLGTSTQYTYRNEVEKIRKAHGHKPVALLDKRGVKKLIAEKAELPGAANKLLRTLRMLMKFAIEEELREDDPTAGLKPLPVAGDGFVAWSEADIEQFEAKHPVGSKARLALALLLYTAQRRSDVVRMGRQHVRGGLIAVRQQKTGSYLDIPIHPDLAAILARVTIDIPAFLLSEHGKPFGAASFGNWFGDRCREAGLPKGHNAHGLRKAAARRLAEAGCTTLEIMSITGHRTIAEIERYTRSAAQPKLAASGIAKLGVSKEP